jgi:hypothetical protein
MPFKQRESATGINQDGRCIMSLWERRRILIWGKTRPELSSKHCETVCTGGVFADTKAFVRLYPIPLRYLDDEKVFRKYQWIDADVRRASKDPRPESYNIRPESIEIGETIPPRNGNWDARAEWLTQPEHIFDSVRALREARDLRGTSIGMIKPDEVIDFPVHAYPPGERDVWMTKYRQMLSQQEFAFEPNDRRPIRPISPPDYRFKIKFLCGNDTHTFSVFDWEIDALYYRCRSLGDSAEIACGKVVGRLRETVCSPRKDTYFFLGNIANHPHIFTIVGLWYPTRKRVPQAMLF